MTPGRSLPTVALLRYSLQLVISNVSNIRVQEAPGSWNPETPKLIVGAHLRFFRMIWIKIAGAATLPVVSRLSLRLKPSSRHPPDRGRVSRLFAVRPRPILLEAFTGLQLALHPR